MIMTGLKYIDLAKQQFLIEKEENIRCGISRYYYGLLHYSIDKLVEIDPSLNDLKDSLNIPYEGKSIHTSTISALKEKNPPIASDLNIVKKLRVISDYDFNTSILNDLNIEYTSKKQNLKREFKTKNEILNFLDSVYNRIQSLQNKNKPHNGFNTMSLALAGLKKKL